MALFKPDAGTAEILRYLTSYAYNGLDVIKRLEALHRDGAIRFGDDEWPILIAAALDFKQALDIIQAMRARDEATENSLKTGRKNA